ncbi:ABC transporter permease/substrate-binding protein [Fusobacterium sp.]|uniref:ABC transporter permease/substrate-binding protein n=1 Tax=Fusobacterium sp. TaxID=68766 RepID=UPI00260B9308|nr:ABC transporter permease/substrate-binding protein [Fusobacterium sp.]
MNFFTYVVQEQEQILSLLIEHINLTLISVLLAIVIGVPLGILISHFKSLNKSVMGIANTVQAVPSMALLGFLIPFLGIGLLPSVFMVVLYSLLPIIKNTYTSIEGINPQMIEAAEGMGLTKFQILYKIQIPMALPVIMAGIRISAVTAVGLMTIAAFVGAGGLGFLVFSGIRTANTNQILAGAIPACLLALFIDWTAAAVEKVVVPKGISNSDNDRERVTVFQKIIIGLTLLLSIFIIGKSLMAKFHHKTEKVVTVASKDYTEQIILNSLLADLIESKTDIKVNRKFALGGTQVIFGALNSGEVDVYMEYTGTMFADMLKHNPVSRDIKSSEVYSTSKREIEEKYDVIVGKEMRANNTYRLAVRRETAEKYKLKNISDLKSVAPNLIISSTFEFTNRHDGLPGLLNAYPGLRFKDSLSIDGALRYQAIANGESDIIDAFATDGLIKTYDLVVLEDDKEFFLPYHAAPLMRKDLVERYPELMSITDSLIELLSDDVMRELNNQVDTYKKDPQEVAHQFLIEKGLISK